MSHRTICRLSSQRPAKNSRRHRPSLLGPVDVPHTALARVQNCSQRVDFPAAIPASVRGNPRVGSNFGRVPQGFHQNPPLRHQFRLQGDHPCGTQLACTGGFWVETGVVWGTSTGPNRIDGRLLCRFCLGDLGLDHGGAFLDLLNDVFDHFLVA